MPEPPEPQIQSAFQLFADGRVQIGRIIAGQPFPARPLTLRNVLAGAGGFLFSRYVAEE